MECAMGCYQSKKRRLYMDEDRRQSYIVQAKPSKETRPELTDEQKSIIRETWAIVKLDISRVGVVLFMRLFEKYPDTKQLFVHFRGLTSDELRNNDKLRDHGLRVMNTIDKCVNRIDRVDKLELLLHELGQKHVILNIKTEYLDLIVPQLQQAIIPILADRWTYLVESAWSTFLRYVIHVMSEAMVL